jgi:hypothetical protein
MCHLIARHAPVSLYRFPTPAAAYFSHDGARENRVIQPQLVEISAVFSGAWGWFIPHPSGLASGGSLSKPCILFFPIFRKKKDSR